MTRRPLREPGGDGTGMRAVGDWGVEVFGLLRARLGARIRWKILAPYLLLSLLLAALATYFVTRAVSGSLEERFVNQLAESARVTADSVVRREREHLEVVRAVAFTAGVSEAIADRDADSVTTIIRPIAANSGAEFVAVFDEQQMLVAGMRLRGPADLEYEPVEADVAATLAPLLGVTLEGVSDERGDKHASLIEIDGAAALVTSGPIASADAIGGAVVVATPLASLLPAIKLQALADVSFYAASGAPLGSTFVVDDDSTLAPAPLELLGGSAVNPRSTRIMAGRPYQFLYAPLYVRGEAIGTLSVALPTAFVTSADQATRTQMAILFGTATVAVLAVGIALSRVLSAPIARLARVAAAVSAGDLTARSGISGRDEIGTLGSTFDVMTDRLQRQHLGTIRALVSAIDARDPYTRGHSVRVGHLSVDLGASLGLSEAQLQHLQIGGYLHDIGKIGVRDSVLLKPGALTPEERSLIEEHPRVGLEILDTDLLPDEVLALGGQHHERLDGTGYPFALAEEELTVFPRIAAVADVYDALTTDRPYRAGMSVLDALQILGREVDDGLLDPEVVSAMIRHAALWEERLRDDPTLEGNAPTSGLYVPSATMATHPIDGHQHPHVA